MKCILCKGEEFIDDTESVLCKNCGLLLNKNAWEKDYTDGGGQAVPSESKRKLRLENSEARFQLFEPFIEKNSFFIDIGCGSGEMLEVSKKYTQSHLGFDTNTILIEYDKSLGLNVVSDFFDKKYLNDEKNIGLQKVFAASHVIEHMDEPLKFVNSIYDTMNNGDIFYVEVPLYTGELFKKKRYNCNLWIDEHIALYSLESLKFISDKFDFEILELDCRNFINESKSRGFLMRNFIKNPFKFVYRYFTKHKRQQIADNIFRDYGYIILKKSSLNNFKR
jgi:SAM-dependent methyltransferase